MVGLGRPRPRQWWLRNKKSSLAFTKEHRGPTTTDLVRELLLCARSSCQPNSHTRTRTRTCTKLTMAAPLHVLTRTQQILDLVFVVLLIKMGKVFRETLTVRPSPNQSVSQSARRRCG